MPTPGRGKRSAEEKKALKAEQKKKREQKRAKKQEEEDAKAAEEAAKAVAIKEVVTVIQEMEWPRSSLQQQEKREQTGLFADGKKKIVWSEVYYPVKETVAAVLDPKNSKIVYKKTAKKSMVDGAPLVDYSSHPVVPNFFGGQYSPFLPIAALGAAITIGDRSSVTLGAMTLAGIVTAMQLNNAESGGKALGGLKKSWEEQAFDSARDYLLAAVDNIGKLDVQSDGDAGDSDSENDDTNYDIYPRHFVKDVTKKSKAETKATERAITILRAACPEQMHKLAKLSTENKYVAEAIANMEKYNEAWGDLQFGRSELKLLHENPTSEGAFGEDGDEFEGTVYMPWKKEVNIAGTEIVADVFQDRKDLSKFWAWTDDLREDGAEY